MSTPRLPRPIGTLVLVVTGILCLGCSSGPGDTPSVGQVTGTVTFEGQALPGAEVTFSPSSGRPSTAVTDDQGHYELLYTADLKGAKVGRHTVKISKMDEARDAQGELVSAKETLPATYNVKSKLDVVVEGKEQILDFDLKADGS